MTFLHTYVAFLQLNSQEVKPVHFVLGMLIVSAMALYALRGLLIDTKTEQSLISVIMHFFQTNFKTVTQSPNFYFVSVRDFFPMFKPESVRANIKAGLSHKLPDFDSSCNYIRKHADILFKMQLVRTMFDYVYADWQLSDSESDYLQNLIQKIGLEETVYFAYKKHFDTMLGNAKAARENAQKQQEFFSELFVPKPKSLQASYQLLEIEEGASNSDVKKAYRRLVKLHHPDKLQGASSEDLIQAQEKFGQLTDAYHRIKHVRKMK